ncbi:hypothetical protein [Pseudomonas oryzihabitans]|uniref:hypothetical protein n=1 Tax=Pseudomonas oryzihabitans TaxID=47885 RepID=UPI00241FB2B5|nr:hypothetical protein [Pseudomonas oryzihabitans]
MKVKLKRGADSKDLIWLDSDDVLMVLGVEDKITTGVNFLLWSCKQESCILMPASKFDIVDDSLSGRWVISLGFSGRIGLFPKAWLADEFWDKFYNDNPEAVEIFWREFEAMKKEYYQE